MDLSLCLTGHLDAVIFPTTLGALNVVILPPSSSQDLILPRSLPGLLLRHLSLYWILHGSWLIVACLSQTVLICLITHTMHSLKERPKSLSFAAYLLTLLLHSGHRIITWYAYHGLRAALIVLCWLASSYYGSYPLILAILCYSLATITIDPSQWILWPLLDHRIWFSITALHTRIWHLHCHPLSWNTVFRHWLIYWELVI